MNTIQHFWSDFCAKEHLIGIDYKEAFQFGASANWLAQLVVEGKKTATTSGYVFYELEKEEIPKIGEYAIVLNAQDEPVAVIQNQSIEVVPMNEVTEEFALAEGEGDYSYWWNAHEKFFTNELNGHNLEFSPNMLVVCERFKKVYPL